MRFDGKLGSKKLGVFIDTEVKDALGRQAWANAEAVAGGRMGRDEALVAVEEEIKSTAEPGPREKKRKLAARKAKLKELMRLMRLMEVEEGGAVA